MNSVELNRIYKSNNYGDFKIVRFISSAKHSANNIYEIEFINTGSKRTAKLSNIRKGEVRDYSVEKRTRFQGLNTESEESIRNGSRNIYDNWLNMLRRCNEDISYKDVRISDEWLNYTNFKNFVLDPINGYRDNYRLDKDLLSDPDDRVYSTETCVYLPPLINGMLIDRFRNRWSPIPPGVQIYNRGQDRIKMAISYKGRFVVSRFFNKGDELLAFCYYKLAKEYIIKLKADDLYKNGEICSKAYNGLMKYSLLDSRTNRYSEEEINKVVKSIPKENTNELYKEIKSKYIKIERYN